VPNSPDIPQNSAIEDATIEREMFGVSILDQPFLRSPLFWIAAFLVLNFVVPFLKISTQAAAIIGALTLTFAYISIVIFFAVSLARLKLSIARLLVLGVFAALLWALLDQWLGNAILAPIIATLKQTKARPDALQTLQFLAISTFTDLSLLALAVCAGLIASRLIRAPNMLAPICAVIALIDVWGVLFGGIVAQLMEKTPQIAQKAMTQGPQIGAATASRFAIPMPHIGVGDYLFLGLLFGVLAWHNLNWRAAMAWTIPLVSVALLAISFGLIPALPGLLFIALGVAIPNLKTLSYTREEKFAMLYAGVFVALLTIALYFGFTSLLPQKK
jgi:hypothetical protein